MSLRLRLTIGYAILFTLSLSIVGTALYAILEDALQDEADRALRERSQQIERAIALRGDDLTAATLDRDIFALSPPTPSQEIVAPGIHTRVLWPDGDVVTTSSAVAAQLPTDAEALAQAATGQTVTQTIEFHDRPLRVMYRPLAINGGPVAILQLAESMVPVERTLAEVRTLLAAAGAMAMVAGFLAGWWLTQQSFRPIDEMTETVAGIAATGEFDRRVPETGINDEIGRLAATFNALLERISVMLDRQRALVADTSHELRNPLMVVRGNLELLAQDLPAADRREAAADAIEEIDRMTRMIQDLLFLADVDTGTAIEQYDVRLDEIVADISADAEIIATRKDGTREIVLEANDPLVVRGDPGRLRQLLWNLVENAIRYTPAGGTITIALRLHGPVAEVTVSDTGIGIPPQHLPHIFERFYRVDTGRSRALGGTGLGLSIVRQIAEAHGGQVRVRSAVGEGSTFTVALPVAGGLAKGESSGEFLELQAPARHE